MAKIRGDSMYKLVIVDDELTEIKFVRYVVNTFKLPFYICGEGETGEEGIELVRKHDADFVIMDINMPMMDGLTAARIIKREYPLTKIYLLTAYESFEYARQAVKVDVDDYLLKPIRPEQLVDVLKKGIAEVLRRRLANREINKMKQKVETARPLLKRQLMYALVTGGKSNNNAMISMKNVLGLGEIKAAGVLVVTVCNQNGKIFTGNGLRETLVKNIGKDIDFNLCEILPSGDIVVLLKTWGNKKQQALNKIIESWERSFEIQVYAGFALLNDQGSIPSAFNIADKLRRTALFWHKPGIFLLAQLGSIQDCLPNVPVIQKTVFNCLLERKVDKARDTIQGALRDLHNRFIPPEQIMTVANQIVNALLFELTEQAPGNEASIIAQQYLESSSTISCYDELENSLFALIEVLNRWFCLPNETLTEQSIHWAASYIRQNYHDNITLEQMAGKLFLSPSYFSRLFKKHIGEGFAFFVTRIRLEHAQNLLVTGKLSVAQVAKQVGYYDPSYFSTVYKKHFDVSPQQVISLTDRKE
ncbi:response regulator [Desulfosporosinus sp. BICA1-9]|uniref:response regulator transcription factor n=1 Tax=Desulfosporosinus sp. BICA1-9 TaxID=1531958 RepID=UPI00054C529A|nr:response regulator [Desulfosporosinus sp. BICA1-9]KJS50761.1 MAG: hypothetical protein VR66_01070 [Peptococcaceae bacterium BRH_c23]KJS90366.1 MAG: hypothetical protein JL57_02220 [Desulfosporosinus sp. BICA1-9]HBW38364.1 DNA-binding response regulator [Desulfosporosinus sp.]